MDPSKQILDGLHDKIEKTIHHLREHLAGIRTGRASPALVETIRVDYYGSPTPLMQMAHISVTVNGKARQGEVEPRTLLVHFLREHLNLTGAHVGCDTSQCGACTVLIDGRARYACMTLAIEVDGHEVTTVEGLMNGEELGTTQRAFADEDAFQCGYCTPGQVMAAESLLRVNPSPSLDEIRQGMAGNLCRCGPYAHIFKAVAKAAGLKRQGR